VLIIYAIAALGLIGLLFGLFLATAARIFAVETDPRVEAVKEVLPNVNCGACGYAGCVNFAEAVVHGEAPANGCIPGGDDTTNDIAALLGQEISDSVKLVATIFCIGDYYKAADRFIYEGVEDCSVAGVFHGGFKTCSYGCLGLGNCVRACPFDAIRMGTHGLPVIDTGKCHGCGLCVKACPRDLIEILPFSEQGYLVLCNSNDRGKSVAGACTVGCIACKACIKACPREAIIMEENLAVIDLEKCDDCGECALKCKPGTIHRRSSIPSEEEALAAVVPEKASESA
jgi:Na+-translocating ferredoxin:NAD+ oxidoreductase subunit B